MKNLTIALAVAFACTYCSSSKKVEVTDSKATTAAPGSTTPKVENSATKKVEAKKDLKQDPQTICKKENDIRIVKVDLEKDHCEVIYEKFGKSNSIASADSDLTHCSKVFERVKGNLEGAGFKCDQKDTAPVANR